MQQPDSSAQPAGVRFTVYDPFAECLYCRPTFKEAQRDAEKIGATLIVEVAGDDVLDPRAVLRHHRKQGDQWKPETPPTRLRSGAKLAPG
jgi:hypothetical protein